MKTIVRDAATVICVRQRNRENVAREIRASDYTLKPGSLDSLGEFSWTFDSGFEVLMGQGEVVNWLKSTPDKISIMGYPGEFKFAGGTKDEGESLQETARGELAEEFLIDVPEEAILRPFRKSTTKVINGKQFIMYNFVALEEENPWMEQLDVDSINRKLEKRRGYFKEARDSGSFWTKSHAEKEQLSPEVRKVEWMDLAEAVEKCLTSKAEILTPVNDFQRSEFNRYNITERHPMYATMFTLLALENFKTIDSLINNNVTFDANL